ncbi:MAG: hypothetical protein ACYTF7_12110, partial [Planctomycetota bacterium]
MSQVSNIARRSARRQSWQRIAHTLPLAISVALACSGMAILAARRAPLDAPLPLLLIAPAALALIVCLIDLARHARSLRSSAIDLDTRARTHDQLASALQYAGTRTSDPFEQLATERGERLAPMVGVARLLPFRWPRTLLTLPLGGGLLLASHTLVPTRSAPLVHETGVRQLDQAAAQQSGARLEEAQDVIEQLDEQHPEIQTLAETSELLQELERQLATDQPLDESDLARASEALEQSASELEQQATTTRETLDELRESLSELPPTQPDTDPLRATRDALRTGDHDTAREEIERLLEDLDSISNEDNNALREAIDDLARDLEQIPERDPRADQTPPPTDPESSGTPPQPDPTPRETPDDPGQAQNDTPADTSENQDDQIDQRPPSEPDPSQEQPGEQTATDEQPGSESPRQENRTQSDQTDQAEQADRTETDNPSQTPSQTQEPSEDQDRQSQRQREQQTRDGAQKRIEELRDALSRQQRPAPDEQQPEDQQSTPQAEQSEPQSDPDQRSTRESLERTKEIIERWENEQRQGQESTQDAQELRRRARELIDSMDEQELKELRERIRASENQDSASPLDDTDSQQSPPGFERD